jgi:hypothetical protein
MSVSYFFSIPVLHNSLCVLDSPLDQYSTLISLFIDTHYLAASTYTTNIRILLSEGHKTILIIMLSHCLYYITFGDCAVCASCIDTQCELTQVTASP